MSNLLENTQSQIEELISNFKALQEEANRNETFNTQLRAQEQALKVKQEELSTKLSTFEKDKQTLAQERAYLVRMAANVKVLEENNARKLQGLKEEEEEMVIKRDEIAKLSKTLEIKKKEIGTLEQQLKELESQKGIIEREKTIDRERKALLDAREKRLEERENYINKLSSL